MRRRATGKDVAERAGVSLTTVSLVVNRRKNVAIPEETRQRVLDAARDLGYRPNGLVRGLVRGRTQTIGVIVPRLDSSFHAAVVHGIQGVLRTEGWRMLLADSEHRFEDESHEVELLLQHRVDGLISVALVDDVPEETVREWVAGLANDGVSMVVVDDQIAAGIVDCVTTDDELGARLVVEHLIALGHTHIAHLGAGDAMSSARSRRAGYEAALRDAGLTVDPDLVAGTSYFATPDDVLCLAERLLGAAPRPTAVFCANDDLAAELIAVVRSRGMRVPEDLSVAGYGDTAAGHLLGITTIHQDPISMGRTSAERLFERLKSPELPPKHISLSVRLIRRGTTAPPKAKTNPTGPQRVSP